MSGLWIKICGVTNTEDAVLAVEHGASALGLNFIARSKRRIDLVTAQSIAAAVRGRAECVAVVADRSAEQLRELAAMIPVDRVQLHGSEPPELVESLGSLGFQALGIGDASDVARAKIWPGELLLVDAQHQGQSGGTGQAFDWSLLGDLAKRRRLILAGGLRPENVALAIRRVGPFGVDVASGVEIPGQPRRKDPKLVARFIQSAREAG